MAQDNYPDLSGKIVALFMRVGTSNSSEQTGWTIKNPRFEEQAGRLFLVGETAKDHSSEPLWYEEATIYIPWELVTSYLVFEVEAYRRAANRFPVPQQSGWFGRFRKK